MKQHDRYPWNGAEWIGIKPLLDDEHHPLRGAQWIGPDADESPAGDALMALSTGFELPAGKAVTAAKLYVWSEGGSYFDFPAADSDDKGVWSFVKINDGGDATPSILRSLAVIEYPKEADVTPLLKAGANRIDVLSWMRLDNPAIVAKLMVRFDDGTDFTLTTDSSWECRFIERKEAESSAWNRTETAAVSCRELGAFEDDPWPVEDVRHRLNSVQAPVELRHRFELPSRQVSQAWLYSTAYGVYECEINGAKAGCDHMAPGWTDYRKTIHYQKYDVSGLVQPGENQWTVNVAHGWAVNMQGCLCAWADTKAFLGRLEIRYADGETVSIETRPETWEGRCGIIRKAEVYNGETVDYTYEGEWRPAVALGVGEPEIAPDVVHPPRFYREIKPVEIRDAGDDSWIVDFGQNFTGVVRLRLDEARGSEVVLRHAEALRKDGALMRGSLRDAECTDRVICPGGEVVHQPRFTFRGFRYIEIRGLSGKPAADDVTGIAISNALEQTLWMDFEHPGLNRLVDAIRWTQRSNWFSVPMDCPQRYERLGWMGDSQLYSAAGSLLFDGRDFLAKHVDDMYDAANPTGSLPDFAPCGGGAGPVATYAWADAGVVVPYNIWKTYGDIEPARKHWDGIRAYIQHRDDSADADGLNVNGGYGDWLTVGTETPHEILGPICHALMHRLASEMAVALGDKKAVRLHAQRFESIAKTWRERHLHDDGTIDSNTQTAYVCSWRAGMIPDKIKPKVAKAMSASFARANDHLEAGIIGTASTLDALVDAGLIEVAWKVLTNDEFPSFGYFFKHGMTTIPEWWDAFPDKKVSRFWEGFEGEEEQGELWGSLNHPVFGSVAEGIVKYVLGLRHAEGDAGFKNVVIEPRFTEFMPAAAGIFESVHGTYKVAWRRKGNVLSFDVTVPPQCAAHMQFPEDSDWKTVSLGPGRHRM